MDVKDAKIIVDGAQYPLVQADDMTMREQREFEKIAGAGVDKLLGLQTDYRAGLVVAWMAVSIKREKPQLPMQQIVERLDDMKNDELAAAWQDIADQAAQSPPEPQPTTPGSNGTENSSHAGSNTGLELVPDNGSLDATGSPPSEPSAGRSPVTSQT